LFEQVLARVKGRYVASLDGDDFWTDPDKLEKQVRFLEDNPDCSLCFHNVAILSADGTISSELYIPNAYPRFSTITELGDCIVPACSPMVRREAVVPLPSWYADCRLGDWAMYIIAAEHGRLGYLDEVMGVYRSHGGGLWSSLDQVQKIEAVVLFLEQIDKTLDYRHTRVFSRSLSKRKRQLARLRAEVGMRFDNGHAFNIVLHQLYREVSEQRRQAFGDVTETRRENSFWRWSMAPDPQFGGLSRFLRQLYAMRHDVALAFPDPVAVDRQSFLEWARSSGAREIGYDPALVTGDE
jgi:hypothetical protein